MRSKEVVAKVVRATEMHNYISIDKGIFITEGDLVIGYTKTKKEGFEYISKLDSASVQIQHSEKVVNSTMKKIKAMGFSVELIESEKMSWGPINHWVIINKNKS